MKAIIHPALILASRCEIRLKLQPWHKAEHFKFTFGSCDGLLAVTPTAYELIAVANARPGNGTFAKLLTHLRELAQQHKRDVFVLEIHNPTLGQHLATTYGYRLIPGTRHAMLPVAGPGTVPPAYLTPPTPGPLDAWLSALTSAIH